MFVMSADLYHMALTLAMSFSSCATSVRYLDGVALLWVSHICFILLSISFVSLSLAALFSVAIALGDLLGSELVSLATSSTILVVFIQLSP